MRPELGREQVFRETVDALCGIIGMEKPGEERMKEALEWAEGYRPSVVKVVKEQKEGKKGVPRYFGIRVQQDLEDLLSPVFLPPPPPPPPSASTSPSPIEEGDDDQDPTGTKLFTSLLTSHRLERNPHITLVHESEIAESVPASDEKARRQALWDRYSSLVNPSFSPESESDPPLIPKPVTVALVLGPKIVWDSRVMAVEVSELVPDEEGVEIRLPGEGRGHGHVTVGTRESSIKLVEGKWILEAVRRGETESKEGGRIWVRELGERRCGGSLKGMR